MDIEEVRCSFQKPLSEFGLIRNIVGYSERQIHIFIFIGSHGAFDF